MSIDLPVLKPADFGSDQDVRWCPGCGDYSILAQMKKALDRAEKIRPPDLSPVIVLPGDKDLAMFVAFSCQAFLERLGRK